jgi:glutamate 5-kinase
VRAEGKSLLPIGMTSGRRRVLARRGHRGARPDGPEIARGLANYASVEARLLCRKPSSEIERLLGYVAEPEMIHRDNMVLMPS